MHRTLETALRLRRGAPVMHDLTPYLNGCGAWQVDGWRLADTDEVEVFYGTEQNGFFVLVVKRLAGELPRAYILPSVDAVCEEATKHLTSKDMTRLVFALSWLPR